MEHLILQRISPGVEEILSVDQPGFRKDLSIGEQVLAENGFESRVKTGAVFLDLDLPTTKSCKFIYADDICLAFQTAYFEALERVLTEDLAKLDQFCKTWQKPFPVYSISTM